MKAVSIIIPVYNEELYLEKCIETLINQTLDNIEFIFVDDGSTDSSIKIIKSYAQKDNRIKLLYQNHKKQGAARNLGINIANGQYIGFVDADDWVELDMFEKLYNKAKSTDSDITVCVMNRYNDNSKSLLSKQNPLVFLKSYVSKVFSAEDTLDFLFNIPESACIKLFKKDFLKEHKLNFPTDIYFEDDVFHFNSWLSAKNISIVNEFLYYYRMFSKTSTCTVDDKNKYDLFKVYKKIENILVKKDLYKNLEKDFYNYKYTSIKYWYKRIRNFSSKFIWPFLVLINEPKIFFDIFYRKFLKLYLVLFKF